MLVAVTIGTVFLYQMFGVSAFIGLACVPLSAPISYWVARMSYRKFQQPVMLDDTC